MKDYNYIYYYHYHYQSRLFCQNGINHGAMFKFEKTPQTIDQGFFFFPAVNLTSRLLSWCLNQSICSGSNFRSF